MIDWANAVSELGALAIVLLGFALFVWASYIKDPPLFVPFKMHKEVVDGLTKELDKRDTVIGEQKREIKQQNVDFVRVTSELARQGDIFSRFVDALRTSQREGG